MYSTSLKKLLPLALMLAMLLPTGTARSQSREIFVCLYYAPVEKTLAIMHDMYQSVAHSTDGGATWKGMGWAISLVNDMHIDRESGDYYLAAEYGVLLSSDKGATWKQLTGANTGNVFRLIEHGSALWIATPNGPQVSTGKGQQWQPMTAGLPALNGRYCADILSANNILYIATADGVYRSADNGKSWQQSGLQGNGLDGIVAHPSQPNELCAFNASKGIWLSHDAGASWKNVSEGQFSKKVQTVAYDPKNAGTIFAGLEDFPISKTSDGGKTWTTVNKGMTNNNITAIAIDPQDANTIYAGTENGTWISNDGAATWKPFSVRFGYVRAIRFGGSAK